MKNPPEPDADLARALDALGDPPPRRDARTALRLAALLGLPMLAYALVRYVALGDTTPAHIPLFVLNKAVAFTAAGLLAACLALTPLMRIWPRLRRHGRLRKPFGLAAFGFSALHVVMTMVLLGPAYYPKLHGADHRLSLQGELAVLAGLLSFATLCSPALTSLGALKRELAPRTWTRLQRLSILAFALTGLHQLGLGLPNWLTPAKWPGGLPPITMMAALIVLAVLALRWLVLRRR